MFGFAAALLEGLPIIGLVFTISNRIGAAMWAHGVQSVSCPVNRLLIPANTDLEKRQHFVADRKLREGDRHARIVKD